MGVPVGMVLNPQSAKQGMREHFLTRQIPLMMDNGAYQAYVSGEKPDWDLAVKIAEELKADYIVAMDKISETKEDAEESLKLSLEVFGSTAIETIVSLQSIALGPSNSEQIKDHVRRAIDRGVRVIGIPLVNASKLGNLRFALNMRWMIPRRCHALGFPWGNDKMIRKLRFFDSADGTFWHISENAYETPKAIQDVYLQIVAPKDTTSLMSFQDGIET